jgi:hypothetical protein
LRLDQLGGEDAMYRAEQRIATHEVQIAAQLFDAI